MISGSQEDLPVFGEGVSPPILEDIKVLSEKKPVPNFYWLAAFSFGMALFGSVAGRSSPGLWSVFLFFGQFSQIIVLLFAIQKYGVVYSLISGLFLAFTICVWPFILGILGISPAMWPFQPFNFAWWSWYAGNWPPGAFAVTGVSMAGCLKFTTAGNGLKALLRWKRIKYSDSVSRY